MMRTMQMDEGVGRAVGCLVGAAVGDALGAPFEFGPAGQWSEWFPEPVLDDTAEMVGGGAFGWAPGQFTDDTEMATIVAESLLACDGIDVVDQFERFRAWAAKANDVGNTTRSVLDSGLHPDDAAAEIVRRSGGRGTAGNGSLMRVAAGAIRFAPLGSGETVDAAKRLSAVTHADPLCVWAVAVAHEMVRAALRGDDPLAAIDNVTLWMPREVHDVYSPLLADDWHPGMGGPGNGSAMGALAQAVWALRTSSSYEEVVTKVIDLGGDTDSVAAVAGALAGARWGVDAIPARWRARVHGVVNQRGGDVQAYAVDDLVRLATELLEAGRRDAAERFLPDVVFEEKAANLSDAQRRELRELVARLRAEESHAEWRGGDQVGTTAEEKPILQMPYPVYSEPVLRLMDLLYACELVVPFDWMGWQSASGYGDRLPADLSVADAVRIVTTELRRDHFDNGSIVAAIEDGRLVGAIDVILGSAEGSLAGERRVITSTAAATTAGGTVVVGIDLATTAKKTGVVVLTEQSRWWSASIPDIDRHDPSLIELVVGATKLGVDSPLGWPRRFVEAVSAHSDGGDWQDEWSSDAFPYRTTDRAIKRLVGVNPLSVSTDRLGLTARRCALLQNGWANWMGEAVDRTGAGRIVEVYPAATMKACGLPTKDYKKDAATREKLLADIADQTAGWLRLDDVRAECVASDHVFDGLISAITAVLALRGLTVGPNEEQLDDARREGWIHAPAAPFSLADLGFA